MDSYDVKESPSEKTLSTASSGFQDIALANGVLDVVMSEEAVDKADIIKLLKQPRPSSPPPLDIKNWTKWVAAQKMAQNKEEIKMSMKELFIDWRYQEGKFNHKSYHTRWDVMFNHPSNGSEFSRGLPMAKADAVEGFSKWAFKAPINRINGARCSKDIHSPALPHLLIEFKGP